MPHRGTRPRPAGCSPHRRAVRCPPRPLTFTHLPTPRAAPAPTLWYAYTSKRHTPTKGHLMITALGHLLRGHRVTRSRVCFYSTLQGHDYTCTCSATWYRAVERDDPPAGHHRRRPQWRGHHRVRLAHHRHVAVLGPRQAPPPWNSDRAPTCSAPQQDVEDIPTHAARRRHRRAPSAPHDCRRIAERTPESNPRPDGRLAGQRRTSTRRARKQRSRHGARTPTPTPTTPMRGPVRDRDGATGARTR